MDATRRHAATTHGAADREDLAALLSGIEPYAGADALPVSAVFADDQEQCELVAWVRSERDRELS